MICKAFPHTLSRLLLALCPNVTTRKALISFCSLLVLPHWRWVPWSPYAFPRCNNHSLCDFLGGIQLATAQLPHLQLMDCGMSLCANLNNDKEGPCLGEINGGIRIIRKLCTLKKQPVLQKLIIKHGNLKKLSLWGCSAIDVSIEILSALVHPHAYVKSKLILHMAGSICKLSTTKWSQSQLLHKFTSRYHCLWVFFRLSSM